MHKSAYLIKFSKLGKPSDGYISVGQSNSLVPFDIKRVFWTYYTPDKVIRGRHTHHETEMILIAISGTIKVKLETIEGEISHFELQSPDEGLYIPPLTWHEMEYSHTSVQLVITSTLYDENDYIRSYTMFKQLKR